MDLYHALNRGVEKRDIFLDSQDRARFVHNMFEFNKVPATYNTRRGVPAGKMFDLRSRTSDHERLVDIHGWVLMKNHYHLLLSERIEDGIVLFLRRLNIGYAKYFNEKNKRSGYLFQGRTKKLLISNDAHFLHILHYIHLNPLDFLAGAREWRNNKISDPKKALAYLETHRWSSYRDYCGTKNFPSILTTDLFSGVFGDYGRVLREYLKDMNGQAFDAATLE